MGYMWRPAFRNQPMATLRNEMDRLVGDFFNAWGNGQGSAVAGTAFPSVNLWEEGDALMAEAEVPGLKSDDLDISVVGNQLSIKGRRAAQSAEAGTFHRRERAVGEFVRVLTLPVDVDSTKVEASLANGVLRISLPKAESAKPRRIPVGTN